MNVSVKYLSHLLDGRSLRVAQFPAVLILAFSALVVTQSASAQAYKVLYTFSGGTNGYGPMDQLALVGGALYGSSAIGGVNGDGEVFTLNLAGKNAIHSFSGPDGNGPGGLVRDTAGNLYGVTQIGGSATCNVAFEPNGCGVVFEISASGQFSVLHSFSGPEGANPRGKLLRDAKGNLYGVTAAGGQNPNCIFTRYQQGCGVVFELSLTQGVWDETVLYNFGGGGDSFAPNGGLISRGGKLLGTTSAGNGLPCDSGVCGTVFELTPSQGGWTETILYAFKGGSDGAIPEAGLAQDSQGDLFGTTFFGGSSGLGTIFEIDSLGKESILLNFDGPKGAYPTAALVRDSSGNLYGTATQGGSSKVGTAFKLDLSRNLTVLHNFTGGTDGANPYAPLLLVQNTLYGATVGGGAQNAGTVFELAK